MIGKPSIHLTVKSENLASERFQDCRDYGTCRSVTAIDSHLDWALDGDVALKVLQIGLHAPIGREVSLTLGEPALFESSSEVLQFLPINGLVPDRDLESIEISRVMAGCDHHPAFPLKMEKGEIIDRCWTDADVRNIASG